jgi:hypothetical protein
MRRPFKGSGVAAPPDPVARHEAIATARLATTIRITTFTLPRGRPRVKYPPLTQLLKTTILAFFPRVSGELAEIEGIATANAQSRHGFAVRDLPRVSRIGRRREEVVAKGYPAEFRR